MITKQMIQDTNWTCVSLETCMYFNTFIYYGKTKYLFEELKTPPTAAHVWAAREDADDVNSSRGFSCFISKSEATVEQESGRAPVLRKCVCACIRVRARACVCGVCARVASECALPLLRTHPTVMQKRTKNETKRNLKKGRGS